MSLAASLKRVYFTTFICTLLALASCGGGGTTNPSLSSNESLIASGAGGHGGGGGTQTKPVAVPGVYPPEGGVPMLAHFYDDGSYDPDGEIVKWEWNFGDSAGGDGAWEDYTETEGDAWHTYEHPGTAVAHLRVTDDDGNKATEQVKITIRRDLNAAPWAAGDATIVEGDAPLTVQFNAEGSYDPDGEIVTWEWNFSDGAGWEDFTATEGAAEHEYDAIQEYDPRLRVTDDDGASSEVEVLIYEVLFSEEYDPSAGLRIDLGDGSWLYFPPGMLETAATVQVYEGHKYAPWDFYVTGPVRVEITLPDGTDAPEGTEYEYGYDTSYGYTEDYDLTYFSAPADSTPYPMYGWAKNHGDGELLKNAEYAPTQHLAVMELNEANSAKGSSSFWHTGLEYDADEDLSKPINVVFVHGLDPYDALLGVHPGFPPYIPPVTYPESRHWWKYVNPNDPYRILGAVMPESRRQDIAVGWFYYNTVYKPIFDTDSITGSGSYLANELRTEVLDDYPDTKVVLVGYSMGATVIRAACMNMKQHGGLDNIAGVITLNGVNNGTEWVNYALTGTKFGWFGLPDMPGPSQLASIYDIKHNKLKPGKHGVLPDGFTNNANIALYNVITDDTLKQEIWDTDCYIRLGSFKLGGFSGFTGPFVDLLIQNKKIFNGITELRSIDDDHAYADESFLKPSDSDAFHDGIVSTGSQFAVGLHDTTYDDSRPGGIPNGWWHDYDHLDVLNRKSDVDEKLQEAIAYIVNEKCQPPYDETICFVGPGTVEKGEVPGFDGIYTMDFNGDNLQLITDCYDANSVRMSPDGSKLVFSAKDNSDAYRTLWVVNSDGSGLSRITALQHCVEPVWYNNSTIVFRQGDIGHQVTKICRINIDGSGYHPLTPDDGYSYRSPVLSPDRTRIAYATFPGTAKSLSKVWVADYPGFGSKSFLADVTNGNGIEAVTDWSTQDQICFYGGTADPDLYVVYGNGTGLANITPSGADWDEFAGFTEDGNALAFHRRFGSSNQIWTMKTDKSGLTYRAEGGYPSVWYSGLNVPPPAPQWHTETVDAAGDVGWLPWVTVDSGGRPHVCYADRINKLLKYQIKNGGGWQQVGFSPLSIAHVEGFELDQSDHAHIIYTPGNWASVNYGVLSGGTWLTSVVHSPWPGTDSGLALDSNGNPHVTYDGGSGRQMHAYNNGGGWQHELVYYTPYGATGSAVRIDSAGRVQIVHTQNYSPLQVFHSTGQSLFGGPWQTSSITAPGYVPCLAIDGSDHLHMSYMDGSGANPNTNVRYGMFNGNSWSFSMVDNSANMRNPSVAADSSGTPHISYYDKTQGDLMYATPGPGGWQRTRVDETGDVGYVNSIAVLPGDKPCIAYYDQSNGDLKFAWLD